MAEAENDDDLIATAMNRFTLAAEAESDPRKLSLEDFKFRVGEQWPMNIKQSREIDQRPCLTINKTTQFIRQVTNDVRQNRPSLRITAVDDKTEDTADVLEGIVRHIQADSDADIAYDTAMECAVTGGFGYFRVLTDYCDENSFDQDIKIKRIKNPFSVYFDPNAVEPDYSDANWCFIVSDMPKDDFGRDYPDHKKSDVELSSIGDSAPGWCTSTDIRIAEYFTVKKKAAKLYLLSNGQETKIFNSTKFKKDKDGNPILPDGLALLKERATEIREVCWYKITAFAKLEERIWPGKYIPVIPVLGEDIDIDGTRNLYGIVRGLKDPQRMFNYMSTAMTEAIALAPKAPFIIAEGQDEGFETYWDNANTRNYSRLPYKPIDMNGNLLPAPKRETAEPPIQAMAHALAQYSEDMKATTGIYDASLGARSNEQSGRAIMARQQEGDVANFNYSDNLRRSIKHLGRVLLDLIPKIYDAPRIMRILHEDGTSKTVKVNQPSDQKDENGVAKVFDLTTGKYDVEVSVGPSYATKRMESAAAMTDIVRADPTLMAKAGDIIVREMDFPGHNALADRLRMFLPPEVMNEEDEQQPLPPQVKAQMAQMGQMVQALSEQLNATLDEAEGKKAEIASKEKIAAQNNATKIKVAIINNETDANLTFAKNTLERAAARENHHADMVKSEHMQAITPPEPVDSAPAS